MASQCDNTISIESLFSAFMKLRPEAMEKITVRLDMEITRAVKNWRHFARELKVAPEVIESLKWYGTFSPTANVFDNLEFTKPDLTISTLKEVFTNIGRNDLKQLLDRVFKAEDDGEKVTAVLDKVPLTDIALGLDRFKGPTANWEDFAMHKMIGVAKNRGEAHQFGSPQLEDPTAQLFQYLETKRSQLTLGELYDVLSSDSVKRPRTAKRLIDSNVEESSWRSRFVKTVIAPESDLLREISRDLNRKVPGTGDWKTVASKFEIRYKDYIQFENRKEKRSPTREVLDKVVSDRPQIAILEIVQALGNIERQDVIEVIKEELGVEDLTQAMRNLIRDKEDAAVILPDSSVSPGPSGSDEPSGSTAPVGPTWSNGQENQPQVFLSYQWDIQAKVIELKRKLELKGLTCWMDRDRVGPGDELKGEIEHGISHCKVFISCMTKKYCTSEMCQREANLACNRKKHIIPMLFENLNSWPPKGSLGMVFSDTVYLRLPGGILTNEKFEELLKKIMEFVPAQNE